MPLVIKLARHRIGQGVELDDLIQMGVFGLMRAADMFDPDRGVQFGTYAYQWAGRLLLLLPTKLVPYASLGI